MNNLKYLIILVFVVLAVISIYLYVKNHVVLLTENENKSRNALDDKNTSYDTNPLSIVAMRNKSYPGSNLKIEQTLSSGTNYNQYIASYKSDNLTIYGLLTVPDGQKPKNGWPLIVFNHGYIAPETYVTTQRYVAYVDEFARNGYIVFKPDYRGNGNSQGNPEGAYYSPGYATDVLNAVATLKEYKDANPQKIGMWGHSMGGNITLRDIVVDTKDIKAAVIWGGVVGSYNDLMNNWHRTNRFTPSQREIATRNSTRKKFTDIYGTPQQNPTFWNAIDPTYFISDITTPIQLHTGGNDEEVPPAFSVGLEQKLKNAGKTVEYYNYPGGDHNISSPNFELAMQRSLDFFNKYLKGGE